MQMGSEGLQLTARWESCRLLPYLDAVGIPTQRFGATRGLDGSLVKLTDPAWTPAQALMVLRRDALIAARGMESLVDRQLHQNQVDSLGCWVFNLGAQRLKTSTLLRCINGRLAAQVRAEWVKWNRAGGK